MILKYSKNLKPNAQHLRSYSTNSEIFLWSRLRKKQLLDIQFYRQKPIGHYIVDFYAAKPKLVIEINGGQHFEKACKERDQQRDDYLKTHGLAVLRFTNLEVLISIDAVVEVILHRVRILINLPQSPFLKGGS